MTVITVFRDRLPLCGRLDQLELLEAAGAYPAQPARRLHQVGTGWPIGGRLPSIKKGFWQFVKEARIGVC